jgi:hypothetical protein
MKRWLVLPGLVLTGVLATVAPAATDQFECNGTFTGKTVADVTVPLNGACTLIDSTVTGNVTALQRSYFQATHTSVHGNVVGTAPQTIFIERGTAVKGSVRGDRAAQVFLFDSAVAGDVAVNRATNQVYICGMTIKSGDVEVRRSGKDILIGDPTAEGCAGNRVRRGDVEVVNNATHVEFTISGNVIARGDLEVLKNRGLAGKVVEDNNGGDKLECRGNRQGFDASGNPGWEDMQGQCAPRRN